MDRRGLIRRCSSIGCLWPVWMADSLIALSKYANANNVAVECFLRNIFGGSNVGCLCLARTCQQLTLSNHRKTAEAVWDSGWYVYDDINKSSLISTTQLISSYSDLVCLVWELYFFNFVTTRIFHVLSGFPLHLQPNVVSVGLGIRSLIFGSFPSYASRVSGLVQPQHLPLATATTALHTRSWRQHRLLKYPLYRSDFPLTYLLHLQFSLLHSYCSE